MKMSSFKIAIVLSLVLLTLGVSVVNADAGWVRSPSNPVLSPSATGWDSELVLFPRVLYDGTGYKMWYTGAGPSQTLAFYRVGYAKSSDGITWTKSAVNPVLLPGPAGSWDSDSVASPSILYNGSAYMMWYVGAKNVYGATFNWWMYSGIQSFGLATSTYGITWEKYPANPVMTGSAIDSFVMYNPWVLRIGNQYKMWYTCTRTVGSQLQVCYASSSDGIHWKKNSTPVFNGTGFAPDWDSGGVYAPDVIYDGQIYGMWYSGYRNLSSNQYASQIGYATSTDGMTWSRAAGNPILGPGVHGSWEGDSVDNPSPVQVNGTFRLYYAGWASANSAFPNKIGFAESPTGFALPELPSPMILATVAVALVTGAIAVPKRHRNKT